MTRYQTSKGLYGVIRSESNYIARKITEFGLVKDGAVDPAGVDLLAQRNPNEIVDQELAAKADNAAAAKEQAKKEGAILSAVDPSVDNGGVIKSADNNVLGRILIKGNNQGDISITLLNQGGQVVATGIATSAGNRFTTTADQKQHAVDGVNYFDFSSKDFMTKNSNLLTIAKYFVKKEYLK